LTSTQFPSSVGFVRTPGRKWSSVAHGDINHGSDGYYQQWAEEQMRKEEELKAEAEQNEMLQAQYEQDMADKEAMAQQMEAEAAQAAQSPDK
jgi:hypothetical protein